MHGLPRLPWPSVHLNVSHTKLRAADNPIEQSRWLVTLQVRHVLHGLNRQDVGMFSLATGTNFPA